MRVSSSTSDTAAKEQGGSFNQALGQQKPVTDRVTGPDAQGKADGGVSSDGLLAPDGQTRNPFPASLVAYIEVLRSVAEYLRQQGVIPSNKPESVAEMAVDTHEEVDVAEPTTFAIGEEDHDCPPAGPTPAIGEHSPA